MESQNVPTVSSVADLQKRLLARAFNGESRFSPEEMQAKIEQHLAHARESIAADRLAEISTTAENNKTALGRLNTEMEARGLPTRYVDRGVRQRNSAPN